MVNLLPGELREEENNKKKKGEIKKEIEMVEPELPKEPPRQPIPAKPFEGAVPPTKPQESSKFPKFGKPGEVFQIPTPKRVGTPIESVGAPKEKVITPPAPKLEEEWTLPKQVEEGGGVLPEVSLSPGKIVILPRTVKTKLLSLLVGTMVLLFIFTGVWWWTNNYLKKSLGKVKAVQEEIKTVEKEIEPYLEVKQRIANIENKFGKAQRVLGGHIYWTKFFTLLEKYTVPEVSFNGFSGNTSGSIHLNAGTLSLPSVGRQMLALKEASDFVEKAEISNIVMSAKGVTFSLELILKPNVFYLGK